jgi:hypothetical protein
MKKAKYLVFIGIGVELFAYTMTGIFIGRYIDDYLSATGLYTAILIFIFGGFWFYRILSVLKRLNRDQQ